MKKIKEIKIPIRLPSYLPFDKKVVSETMHDIIEKCINNEMSPADLFACLLGWVQFFASNLDEQATPSDILREMIHELENIDPERPVGEDEIRTYPILMGDEVRVDL